MKLSHPFSKNTRELFSQRKLCSFCGYGGWDALHHIDGRTSSSPYNASPVHNHGCHIEFGGALSKQKGRLFAATFRYLLSTGHAPTANDRIFLHLHSKEITPHLLPSEVETLLSERFGPQTPAPGGA